MANAIIDAMDSITPLKSVCPTLIGNIVFASKPGSASLQIHGLIIITNYQTCIKTDYRFQKDISGNATGFFSGCYYLKFRSHLMETIHIIQLSKLIHLNKSFTYSKFYSFFSIQYHDDFYKFILAGFVLGILIFFARFELAFLLL